VLKLAEALRLASSIKRAGPRKFTQHMMPHVVRPAQIIWNKALGGVFLLLALLFFGSAVNYFRGLSSLSPNPVGLGFSFFLGVVMAAFGINSFLKARRLSRL
jgi:hypothetical protein